MQGNRIPTQEAEHPPSTSPGARSGTVLTVEQIAWTVILAAAALLRLVRLDAVPLSQAEGLRGLQTYAAAQGNVPNAWPGGVVDVDTALL
jgi:hypothetical protein